jgi:hypothetical protein
MLAKPGCDGVLAAASFSTRANISKTNRFQVLKKEASAIHTRRCGALANASGFQGETIR